MRESEFEKKRLLRLTKIERRVWSQNGLVAGFDEAGAGPLAGPVVAACVILDPSQAHKLSGVNDSKKVSKKRRKKLFDLIHKHAFAVGCCFIEPGRIDEINVFWASLEAMSNSWYEIVERGVDVSNVTRLLIDGPNRELPIDLPQQGIIGGDGKSLSIAAASIIAKTERDAHMIHDAAVKYPEYGFQQHKGYCTPLHLKALQIHGACEIHRRSFGPVKAVL